MLKRTPQYKTAEQLKITPAEWNALQKVREGLLNKTYIHSKITKEQRNRLEFIGKGKAFNMNVTYMAGNCGGVGCIGGWVGAVMGEENPAKYAYAFRFEGNLKQLYYPSFSANNYDKITTAQAAKAIHYFLQTGDPCWGKVFKGSKLALEWSIANDK